jgi:nicotinate-nucleotide pyrophosphorylase (carboxylating)
VTATFTRHGLSEVTGAALASAGLEPEEILGLLRAALAEDLGDRGDLTSQATVPADARVAVCFTARQPGVVCGLWVVAALVDDLLGTDAIYTPLVADGDRVAAGERLTTLEAPARAVLALERTALNLLCHLSGVATATRAWADALEGTGAVVRDTRKTLPLLRSLEKYAVRCGGGTNHRAGLYDAVLIKDNHVAVAGGVGKALDAVRAAHPEGDLVVQVEVDSLDQLDEALDHGAGQILLDNFSVAQLREAVRHMGDRGAKALLEASGGLRLENAREVGLTGVDFLAVGALTHSVVALDIGLDAEDHSPPH